MNGRITGWNMDFNNSIQCVVQDGIIYQLDYYTGKTPIGHSNERFNELVQITNEYKQMCIDNGLIEPERTPEEIQAEMQSMINNQNKMMLEMADIIQSLKNEVKEMKTIESTKLDKSGSQNVRSGRNETKSSDRKSIPVLTECENETTGS